MTEIITEDMDLEKTAAESEGSPLVLASELLPAHLPIMPIRPRPLFPGLPIPLEIGTEQIASVNHALEYSSKTLGVVLVRDPAGGDVPENLYRVGVAAKILRAFHGEGESTSILINCVERFTIEDIKKADFGMVANVRYQIPDKLPVTEELKAYSMAIITTLKDLVKLNPLQSEAIKMFLSRSTFDDPGLLADFAANLTTASGAELQEILETFDVRQRIDRVLVLLKREVEISKLHVEINQQIQEKMSGQQREFFLKEQLKAIKKELGLEKEGKTAEIEKFQDRLKGLTLNAEAQKAVDEEMEKLQLLEPHSPEYTVSRNYLDWLTVAALGKIQPGFLRPGTGAADSGPGPLRSGGRQGPDSGIHRGRKTQRRHFRFHPLPGGSPGSREDIRRKEHRRRSGAAFLPFFAGRHARRGGNKGAPPHLYRRPAGQVPPGHEDRRHLQSGDHAG